MSENAESMVKVGLDKTLVKKLLDGLYSGAENKALKVVIGTDGNYHIKSKGLTITLWINSSNTAVQKIHLHNSDNRAEITKEQLDEMGLATYANSAYGVLRQKYSPYIHSLAENIVLFSRAYWNQAIDD